MDPRMLCPICSTDNPSNRRYCHLCDTELPTEPSIEESAESIVTEEDGIEVIDSSSERVKIAPFLIPIALLLLIAIPSFLLAPYLQTPDHIQESRNAYSSLKENYELHKELWITKKDYLLRNLLKEKQDNLLTKTTISLQHIPLEVLLAYLDDELDFFNYTDESFTIFPVYGKEQIKWLITKDLSLLGITSTTVALECALTFDDSRPQIAFTSYRYGEKQLDPALASLRFTKELNTLLRAQTLFNDLSYIQLEQTDPLTSGEELSRNHISWDVTPRPQIH